MYKFIFLIILFKFLILQETLAKTIEESISLGLLKSDKIKIAKKEYIISKQAIDKALKETEFIGTIDISNSQVHNDQSTNPSFITDEISTKRIGISKRLYDFGEKNNKLKLAKINLEKSKTSYYKIEQEVILEIINAHLTLITSKEKSKLNESNYSKLKEQLSAEKIKLIEGASTSTKIAEIEALLAKANSNKIISASRFIDAQEGYFSLTGFNDNNLKIPKLPKILPNSIDKVEDIAKLNHPEIILSKFSIDSSNYEISLLEKSLLPKLELNLDALQSRRDGSNLDKDEITAKISFKMPFLISKSTKASSKELITKNSKYNIENKEIVRKILLDSRISFRKFQTSKIHLNSVKKELESAIILLDNITLENELGVKTYLDKLDKEQDLFDIKLKLINAESDLILNSFLLLKSIGSLKSENFNSLSYSIVFDDLIEPKSSFSNFIPFTFY